MANRNRLPYVMFHYEFPTRTKKLAIFRKGYVFGTF